nr:TadE/TadG family type IV pilus assembly protein [Polymorphobacter sp.]
MMNRLRDLRRDRSGSTALELALMSPFLCALLFSAIDLANGFAMKLALEAAAGRTAELATAPGTVSGSYANLNAEVVSAYGKPYKSANVDNWLECNAVRNASFTGICAPSQQTARYVAVNISAEYVPYFNYGGLLTGSGVNGGFVAVGDATVRIQ